MSRTEKVAVLCQRLTALGYAQHRKIRLYGEELELVANAGSDGEGFFVEGVARRSGQLTRMHIPLHIVQTLKRELEVDERAQAA